MLQRLSDCFAQDWHHDITASHKLNYYSNFKHTLQPELFFTIFFIQFFLNGEIIECVCYYIYNVGQWPLCMKKLSYYLTLIVSFSYIQQK